MKPSSLPEGCSIKREKHNKLHFQPSFFLPSRRCCHNANTSRGPRSSTPAKNSKPGQVRKHAFVLGHSFLCMSQGGVSTTERPQGQGDELVTCQNNQPHSDPSTIAGVRSAKGREKGRPTNSSLLFNSGEKKKSLRSRH